MALARISDDGDKAPFGQWLGRKGVLLPSGGREWNAQRGLHGTVTQMADKGDLLGE